MTRVFKDVSVLSVICLLTRQGKRHETRYWLNPLKGYVVMKVSYFDTTGGDRIASGSSETSDGGRHLHPLLLRL